MPMHERLTATLLFLCVGVLRLPGPARAQLPGGPDQKGEPSKKEPRPGGLANKTPEFPAGLFTAASTVARTSLRHQWVDIPMGSTKLHTWIHYPQGDGKVPVVLLMHYDAGLDDLQRSLADQIAYEGFLVVAPDLTSGFGPNGGDFESFQFPDEALRAVLKISAAEAMRRYKAAYEYAVKLPRSSGKVASFGCSLGGTYSFRFAAEVPALKAAVVFYGSAPDEAAMAKIRAPVAGFYGEDEPNLTTTVERTSASMRKLGRAYEPHIYPGATQLFLSYQVEGRNGDAIAQAWPAAMEFLKHNLQ